jgi:hypothetical protein
MMVYPQRGKKMIGWEGVRWLDGEEREKGTVGWKEAVVRRARRRRTTTTRKLSWSRSRGL